MRGISLKEIRGSQSKDGSILRLGNNSELQPGLNGDISFYTKLKDLEDEGT